MRLICPNCAAQYEVDASVVPDAGRDVQCSNCGRTWFQPSARMLEDEAEAAAQTIAPEPQDWEVPSDDPAGAFAADTLAAPAAPAPAAEPDATKAAPDRPEIPAAQAPAPQPPPASEPAPAEEEDENDMVSVTVAAMVAEQDAPAPVADAPSDLAPAPAAGTTPRRTLDDSLLSILREEAEREAAARRAEGSTFETQEELNLEPAASRAASRAAAKLAAMQRAPEADETADRVAHLHDTGEEDPVTAPQISRRERLPDIEEINSTLRATSDRAGHAVAKDAPQTLAQQRSGFRLGFGAVLMAGLAAMTVYATAPRLTQMVPGLTPALSSYVGAVDQGRIWLDGQLQAIITRLQEKPDA